MKSAVVMAMLSLAAAAGAVAQTPAGEDLTGSWTVVSLQDGGRTAPPDVIEGMEWIVTGDVITVVQAERTVRWTYHLDPTADPAHINLAEGSNKSLGIYQVVGDTLTVCLSEGTRSAERPTAFESRTDSANDILFVLRRK